MFGWFKKKKILKEQRAAHWADRYYSGSPEHDVAAKVALIVAEQLCISCNEFTPETRVIEDLRADDLDTVPLVEALESEFAFVLSDRDVEPIGSVSDLVVLVYQKCGPFG